MKLKILVLVVTLTMKVSWGISTRKIELGSKVDIECHMEEDSPESCTFTRPDGYVVCPQEVEYGYTIPEDCIDDQNVLDIEVGLDYCRLTLSQTTEDHFGDWICTASSTFGDSETEIVSLVEVMGDNFMGDNVMEDYVMEDNAIEDYVMEDNAMEEYVMEDNVMEASKSFSGSGSERIEARVELLNVWGVARLETNKEQEFQCSLISDHDLLPLKWILRYPSDVTETLGAPPMVYDNYEEGWVSCITFTPQIHHQDAAISCVSEQSGEFDSIKMDVFMFGPMVNSFEVDTVQSGDPLTKTYKFAVFPPPSPSNIKWTVNLPTDTIILHPGNSTDGITATDIQDFGSNVYKVDLIINEVSEDMSDQEHSLFIKVSATKEETIPFKIDVVPKEEDVEEEVTTLIPRGMTTKYVKLGSQVDIDCHMTEDSPVECSFIRPDGYVVCPGEYTSDKDIAHPPVLPPSCADDGTVLDIEMGADYCKLTLSQATQDHLGEWICKASNPFSDPESEIITLVEVTDAKVELLNDWPGVAHLEIGKEQEFQCSLTTSQNLLPLKWILQYPNDVTETLGAPAMEYDRYEERWISTFAFKPSDSLILHQDVLISCLSEETEKSDGIKIDVFMFKPMANSFNLDSAHSGEPLNKTYKFFVFPPPSPSNIKWTIDLPTDTIILHPGEHSNGFTATDIEEVGMNVYTVDLFINEVTEDMSDQEHNLFIKISPTKEERIPFKIDVLPENTEIVIIPEEEDNNGQFIDLDKTVTNGTDNNPVNGTAIAGPNVQAENVSLFIIIGIIILCLILCILFYSAKCCNKDKKKEEAVDVENPVVHDGGENISKEEQPLLSAKVQENGQVNPPPLFNEKEYLVKLSGEEKKSSTVANQPEQNDEERRDLEEKLETLRKLTSAPNNEDEKPTESKLKRVPTLPKNHHSHQDDHDQLKEKAQQLQNITKEEDDHDQLKEKAKQLQNLTKEEDKKAISNGKVTPKPKKNISRKSSVDISKEKTIDFTSDNDESRDETDVKTMKISRIEIKVQNNQIINKEDPVAEDSIKKDEDVNRDWKLSPIWKKSIDGLNSDSENSSPVDFQEVELKLKLATSTTKTSEISYTKLRDEKDSSSEEENVIPNTNDDGRPLIGEDSSTDDETKDKSKSSEPLTSPLLVLSKTPVKPSRTSKEGKVATSTPKENTGLTQKPPQSPKNKGDIKSPNKLSSSIEVVHGSQSDEDKKSVTLTRKESCDAGTQTPKIRARSVDLYFGESSSSGSELSLNKEEISEKLIKETQQLKKEVEQLKKKLEDPANDEVFLKNGEH